jgi:tetratricopeptide (TPR) repeat protein
MRAMTWASAVLMLCVACKKGDEKKAEQPPKVIEKQKVEPAPAPSDVTVTSSSPEAIKHFEEGRNLVDHARGGEAPEHFKKAIAADPNFALAHAYLGATTPGAEGTEHLAKAGTLMAKLPEAEQQVITGMQAVRAGDPVKMKAAYAKVLELAPGAWRVDLALANVANGENNPAEAIKRNEHALSVKPDLAIAYNGLAYARANQREWEPAIAAAKKQVELLPKEPNPHDTLGEVLLWSGKYDEAEKEFAAAVALEPKFTLAWQGVGLARAYRGDMKGAHEAFDKRKTSGNANDKLEAMLDDAWLSLAEDKLPAALATIDAVEKDPTAKDDPVGTFAALDRAHMLELAGKYPDATKAYATAVTRADKLAGGAKADFMRGYRIGTLRLAAVSGKPSPDTDKLLAAIDEDVKQVGETQLASYVAHAKGLALWAKKDLKGAIAELTKCDPKEVICRFDLATLQRKSGDKASAEATEKLLRETPRRAAASVFVVTHLPKQ